MDLKLRDKVAVVTGASKGIGLAVTKALVAEGARVIAGARDVGGELGTLSQRGAVHAVSVDLSTPDGPRALVAQADDYGGVDVLVNNVGAVALRLDGFLSVTDDEWSSSLNLNFMAAVRTTRAALPLMLKRDGGSIVTVSSVNSFPSGPGHHRLLRIKSRIDEFFEGTVQGNRPQRHPREHGEPGTGRDCAVAWTGRRGRHGRKGVRGRRRYRAEAGRRQPGWLRDRAVHAPRGSGGPGAVPGELSFGEHHRSRLRDRRRLDQDALTARA